MGPESLAVSGTLQADLRSQRAGFVTPRAAFEEGGGHLTSYLALWRLTLALFNFRAVMLPCNLPSILRIIGAA